MAVERLAVEGLTGLSGELEGRDLTQDGEGLGGGASGQQQGDESNLPHAALWVAF
jgi:hypothetical protein